MAAKDFSSFARYYDQIYVKMKNYEGESREVEGLIRRFEKRPLKTILDVGCGTAEHLKYLSQHFRCRGVDINETMIEIAKAKVPNAKFEVANMVNFRLKEKFDVVTSMFSSIGYVENIKNLKRTFGNFYAHLNDDGLAIVEPWVFKKDFLKGRFSIDTFEDEKLKLARMGTSKLTRSHWLVCFHYLIGADDGIEHKSETHRMLLAEREDYARAFKLAGFTEQHFLNKGTWSGTKGLFVAIK